MTSLGWRGRQEKREAIVAVAIFPRLSDFFVSFSSNLLLRLVFLSFLQLLFGVPTLYIGALTGAQMTKKKKKKI